MLDAADVTAVSGGADIIVTGIVVTGTPNDPWVDSVTPGDLHALGIFDFDAALLGPDAPNPFGDQNSIAEGEGGQNNTSQDDPDGVEVTLNSEGNLEAEVTTLDGDLSAAIEFNLEDLDVETITIEYQNFSFGFKPDGSDATLTATSGGISAELNFTQGTNSQFNAQETKIMATFKITL